MAFDRSMLAVSVLLAAAACGEGVGESSRSASPDAESIERRFWLGTYAVDDPRLSMCRALELADDGTYQAEFWQGFVTASGCGGPFVGDGCSRGRWSVTGRSVRFAVEVESSRLRHSFRGAALKRDGGEITLHTAAGDVVPVLRD